MVADAKARLRSELLAARRTEPSAAHRAANRQLLGHLPAVVADAATVCAYVPMGSEPGSLQFLDGLLRLRATVLLPIARTGHGGEHLPLQWGRYVPGHLVRGRFGAEEPAEPWLAASAVATAEVVLIPALAVDRGGVRLGRGGGFYDRSLPLCAPDARLVAVVRDSELLEELPSEPHDVLMTHVLTPGAGLVALPSTGCADGGTST